MGKARLPNHRNWDASFQGRPPTALGDLGDLDGDVGARPGQRANCATPWPIVKCFPDNDLTDLRATGPRGPDISKKLLRMGFYSHQSAMQFGKMAMEGGIVFISYPPTPTSAGDSYGVCAGEAFAIARCR